MPRWTRRPWVKAVCAGGLLLATGLILGRFSKPSGEFSDFWNRLDRAGPSPAARSLASCPTPKCLTVYVAPWCGYCRAATPSIIALRAYLKKHGVHTDIIVGMDRPKALAAYAKVFGPDTVLDEDGALAQGGVPHFYVTDKSGSLLQEQAGVPQGIADPKEFASLFGLP